MSKWPVYTHMWDPICRQLWPPRYNRLTDEWLYLAIKFLTRAQRSNEYLFDFDKIVNVRPTRVPCGIAPKVSVNGIVFYPVYKQYYVLCGTESANHCGWFIAHPRDKYGSSNHFYIGQVVVPRVYAKLKNFVAYDLGALPQAAWQVHETKLKNRDQWILQLNTLIVEYGAGDTENESLQVKYRLITQQQAGVVKPPTAPMTNKANTPSNYVRSPSRLKVHRPKK